MNSTILTLTFPSPPVNTREVFGYMGCRQATAEMMALVEECVSLADQAFDFRLCYGVFPLAINGSTLDFGFTSTESVSLAEHLRGCDRVVIFGATVGLEIDRLITRHGRLSPAKGLCLQALGAERIEALCDAFCDDLTDRMATEGYLPLSRFSPGYGDLPLSLQTDIFSVLDCPRRIGLTLNDSQLMSPSKSVTAIVGLKKQ